MLTGGDEKLRDVLRIMSNETNLSILRELVKESTYPSELARRLGIPRSLVNKRLLLMESFGLLRSESTVLAHRRVTKYHVIASDLQLSLDVSSLLFELDPVRDKHLVCRLSETKNDPAYNFLTGERFGVREAISAWIARTLGKEGLAKVFFYEDELPIKQHLPFIQSLGISREGGRFLRILQHDSLRDIKQARWEPSQGHDEGEVKEGHLSTSSGFWICGQGTPDFSTDLENKLREEKHRRRKVKLRTRIDR